MQLGHYTLDFWMWESTATGIAGYNTMDWDQSEILFCIWGS